MRRSRLRILLLLVAVALAYAGCSDDEIAMMTPSEEPDDEIPAGPAVVRLVPSRPIYDVGDSVIVQVVIDQATNVSTVTFHLHYDPQVLVFVPPGIEGPFMSGDGSATVFLASDPGGAGEVVVALSRMGAAEGAEGSGTLAVFQFQAVAVGSCGFAFTGASVKDPQARYLAASFNAASVKVE